MKRKTMLALMLAVSMTCSMGAATTAMAAEDSATEENAEAADTTEASDADQEAADNVAALIDKIYVQERNDTTDEDCKAAKEAWDALTDAQKELVEGEEADPDYFGRDTGDASKDDPRNQDEIGENELLVVSFGTSFNDSRAEDIKGIEDKLQEAYPDWSVRRAFTAQIIINHVEARDDFDEQCQQYAEGKVKQNLIVQGIMDAEGLSLDDKESLQLQDKLVEQMGVSSIAELVGTYGQDYVDESVGLLRVEEFIIKNASVSEKVANGDVLADDADAAAENAEQDSDQNVSDEDTDDSGQDNSDVDENLEEELGTEDVDQSE